MKSNRRGSSLLWLVTLTIFPMLKVPPHCELPAISANTFAISGMSTPSTLGSSNVEKPDIFRHVSFALVEQNLLGLSILYLSRYVIRNKIACYDALRAVQPYCRIENVVEAGIAKRQTASTYLHKLESIGILEEKQLGLNKLFLNSRFLKLLTLEPNDYKRFASK